MTEDRDPKRGNTYEKIVVAAREARRMNAVRIASGTGAGDAKVTIEAMRRAEAGEVEWRIASESEAKEERSRSASKKEDFSFGD